MFEDHVKVTGSEYCVEIGTMSGLETTRRSWTGFRLATVQWSEPRDRYPLRGTVQHKTWGFPRGQPAIGSHPR